MTAIAVSGSQTPRPCASRGGNGKPSRKTAGAESGAAKPPKRGQRWTRSDGECRAATIAASAEPIEWPTTIRSVAGRRGELERRPGAVLEGRRRIVERQVGSERGVPPRPQEPGDRLPALTVVPLAVDEQERRHDAQL